MKAVLSVVLFASMAFAQSVEVTTSKSVASFKNVGTQPIVALLAVITVPGKPAYVNRYQHDMYFKTGGIAVGDTDSIDTGSASLDNAEIVIKFLQYEDGSTWGTDDGVIAQRKAVLTFLQQLQATQSDADFVTVLNGPQSAGESLFAKAKKLRSIYNQYGVAQTRAAVNISLEAAAARKF
jgi:hypothetical protein